MKILVAVAFLILGFAAFSRSSVTRNVNVEQLQSSTSNGNYTVQGEVVSLSESGVILRDAQGVEVRVFGQNDKLVPGASGSLTIQRTGDSLTIAKFIPAAGQSESGKLLGLRYDQASNKMYGNVDKLGWVQVNSSGIFAHKQ